MTAAALAPASPAAAVEAVAPPREAAPQASRAWLDGVSQWLQAHRTYPPIARRLGQQGIVLIRFTVDRDGTVSRVELVRGSGSQMLDDAALTLLGDATLPPFPREMTAAVDTITVPIRYELH